MIERQVSSKDRQPSEQQLVMIAKEVRSMVATQAATLQQHLLPALRNHGVRILTYAELSTRGAYGYDTSFAAPTQGTPATHAQHITATLSLISLMKQQTNIHSECHSLCYAMSVLAPKIDYIRHSMPRAGLRHRCCDSSSSWIERLVQTKSILWTRAGAAADPYQTRSSAPLSLPAISEPQPGSHS